jgi:hypothetical protein
LIKYDKSDFHLQDINTTQYVLDTTNHYTQTNTNNEKVLVVFATVLFFRPRMAASGYPFKLFLSGGAGTVYPSGAPGVTASLSGVRVTRSLILCDLTRTLLNMTNLIFIYKT